MFRYPLREKTGHGNVHGNVHERKIYNQAHRLNVNKVDLEGFIRERYHARCRTRPSSP